MKSVTLTLIEATGIQEYIFSSNNLRQNIGASELVERSTSEWIVDTLLSMKLASNVTWDKNNCALDFDKRSIDKVQAEVIYACGGNALILFVGKPDQYAIEFTKHITRRALQEARGLQLVVGHEELEWVKDSLVEKHKNLRHAIAERKLAHLPNVPLPGLAVTAACEFTGLPAMSRNKDNQLISQVVRHKLEAFQLAEKRLQTILPYDFVKDFDEFGEKDEASYIAVIHTDGNKMGERFDKIAGVHPRPQDNANYVLQLRNLSEQVKNKAEEALQATVKLLVLNQDDKEFDGIVYTPEKKDKPKRLLFRPIVFGGDDVTFVSEGRLGLVLTAKYLQTLSAGKLPDPKGGEGDPLYARAGVAVVKSHYPFSRAYELAEQLCKSAKMKIKDLQDKVSGENGVTVMDWHFSTSGVVLSLSEVRAREYVAVDGKSLLMRPIRFNIDGRKPVSSQLWRSWENFERVVREFLEKDQWSGRRNKIKALRDALRQGPIAVGHFRANYDLRELPDIPEQSTMLKTGWQAEDCGYFDAIEALDYYVRLEK